MDALTYLKEKNRMCKCHNNNCSDCPLNIVNNGTIDLYCGDFEISFPEKAISIVEQWSKEHPRKTYYEDFKSKFPMFNDTSFDNLPCRGLLYNNKYVCSGRSECFICWNTPMEGE